MPTYSYKLGEREYTWQEPKALTPAQLDAAIDDIVSSDLPLPPEPEQPGHFQRVHQQAEAATEQAVTTAAPAPSPHPQVIDVPRETPSRPAPLRCYGEIPETAGMAAPKATEAPSAPSRQVRKAFKGMQEFAAPTAPGVLDNPPLKLLPEKRDPILADLNRQDKVAEMAPVERFWETDAKPTFKRIARLIAIGEATMSAKLGQMASWINRQFGVNLDRPDVYTARAKAFFEKADRLAPAPKTFLGKVIEGVFGHGPAELLWLMLFKGMPGGAMGQFAAASFVSEGTRLGATPGSTALRTAEGALLGAFLHRAQTISKLVTAPSLGAALGGGHLLATGNIEEAAVIATEMMVFEMFGGRRDLRNYYGVRGEAQYRRFQKVKNGIIKQLEKQATAEPKRIPRGVSLKEARQKGLIDEQAYRLGRHFERMLPEESPDTVLQVVDAVRKASPEAMKAAGLSATEGGRILGQTQDVGMQTVISLFRGADATTIVHEWYHRQYRNLSSADRRMVDAWAKKYQPGMDPQEVFATHGEQYFFGRRLETLAAEPRTVFGRTKNALVRFLASVRTSLGRKLPLNKELFAHLLKPKVDPKASPRDVRDIYNRGAKEAFKGKPQPAPGPQPKKTTAGVVYRQSDKAPTRGKPVFQSRDGISKMGLEEVYHHMVHSRYAGDSRAAPSARQEMGRFIRDHLPRKLLVRLVEGGGRVAAVQNLAGLKGVPHSVLGMYVGDSKTAFVASRFKEKGAKDWTQLTRKELLAVVAHEFGHMANHLTTNAVQPHQSQWLLKAWQADIKRGKIPEALKKFYETGPGALGEIFAESFAAVFGLSHHNIYTAFPRSVEVVKNWVERANYQTRLNTPEFKKWFKSSKVVNEAGVPLIVYHGTGQNIRTFQNRGESPTVGYYFTSDPEYAAGYAGGRHAQGKGAAQVVPAHLSIQKPLDLAGLKGKVTVEQFGAALKAAGVELRGRLYGKPGLAKQVWQHIAANSAELEYTLKQKGFDGVRLTESWKGKPRDVWLAYAPEQIKSVFNLGTWDSQDARINYQARLAGTKIVDGKGKPMLVYHGAARGGGEPSPEHGWQYWSAKQSKAQSFAGKVVGERVGGSLMMRGYLNIKNPLLVDGGFYGTIPEVLTHLRKAGLDLGTKAPIVELGGSNLVGKPFGYINPRIPTMVDTLIMAVPKLVERKARAAGFDGIVQKMPFDTEYITFNRNQFIPEWSSDTRADHQVRPEHVKQSTAKIRGRKDIADRFKPEGGWASRMEHRIARTLAATIDKDFGIERFEREIAKQRGYALSPEESGMVLASLDRGIGGKVWESVKKGRVTFDGETIYVRNHKANPSVVVGRPGKHDKPLTVGMVFKGLKGHTIKDFDAYLVDRHTVARHDKVGDNIQKDRDIGDIRKSVKWFENEYPDFKRRAKLVYIWFDTLLSHLKDAGIIDAAQLATIKAKNPLYVPTKRVHSAIEAVREYYDGGLFDISKPLKKKKGSERDIKSVMDGLVGEAYRVMQMADRNRAMQRITSLAESAKDNGFLEKVGGDYQKGNAVHVYEKGVRKTYRVDDKLLLDSLLGLGQGEMSVFMKAMSAPVRALRWGVTVDPAFALKNFIRDGVQSWLFSTYGFALPFYRPLMGLGHVVGGTKLYREWKLAGGSQVTRGMIGREFMRVDAAKMAKQAQQSSVTVRKIFSAMSEFSRVIEEGTRVGEYRAAKHHLKNRGLPEKEARTHAAAASRDVTLDFARHGWQMRGFNFLTAFFNANLQGWNKFYRELNPVTAIRKRGTTGYFGTLARITLLGLAGTALWLANKDDPVVRAVMDQEQGMFAFFSVPRRNGPPTLFRWALPHEAGVFFRAPQLFLDWASGRDPRFIKRFGNLMLQQLGGLERIAPTAPKLVFEMVTGHSLFRDRRVFPEWKKGLKPWNQTDGYTKEWARWLSKGIYRTTHRLLGKGLRVEIPAAWLQYGLENTLGYVGRRGGDLFDQFLVAVKAVPGKVDLSRSLSLYMTKEPYSRSPEVRAAFGLWNEAKNLRKSYVTELNKAKKDEKSGQAARAKRTRAELREEYEWARKYDPTGLGLISNAARYNNIKDQMKQLKTMLAQAQAVRNNPNLDSEAKRVALFGLRKKIHYFAKGVADMLRAVKEPPPSKLVSYEEFVGRIQARRRSYGPRPPRAPRAPRIGR